MLSILGANKASPFDPLVEKATSDRNTTENWQKILEINDRVAVEQNGPKDCLRSIINRLYSDVPWVVLQSLTLLDSLVSNCGKRFHLEICSRDFEQELTRLIRGGKQIHPKVSERARLLLKKWAQSKEFKKDPQLVLIPSLYDKLKSEGISFHSSEPPKSSAKMEILKNPDYAANADEEAQIAKAIELSLQDAKKRGFKTDDSNGPMADSTSNQTSSLYPSFQLSDADTSNNATSSKQETKEPIKVRALYDFEAVEDNELTFKAGEIILVLDSSDTNWWKGSNHRGEGLFPANFVTKDLNAEPESVSSKSNGEAKKVQFNEQVKVVKMVDSTSAAEHNNQAEKPVEIDENKIDELISMLQEVDPKLFEDPPELLKLEEQCLSMMPLIDQQMETIDKMNIKLTLLNKQLSSALQLYHDLMKDSINSDNIHSYNQASMISTSQSLPYPSMVNGTSAAAAPAVPVMSQTSYMPQQQSQSTSIVDGQQQQQMNNYYSQPIPSAMTTTQVTGSYGVNNYGATNVMPYAMHPQGVYPPMMMTATAGGIVASPQQQQQSLMSNVTSQSQHQPSQQQQQKTITAVPNLL